jgi:hypothetical protein
MAKFYFSLLFFVSLQTFGQSFPYLNASTGNADEYPVDKDTNIYMFQGSRLSKVDKNFNAIWSYTYSGVNFNNLLLSKTGSIYFIASSSTITRNYIGKIGSTGNLVWIKPINGIKVTVSSTTHTINGNGMNLMLDGANNIVVTGPVSTVSPALSGQVSSHLIKCDTNGTLLKYKLFNLDYGQNLHVLNDSAGIYKFFGSGPILSTSYFNIYSYSDATDNFIKERGFAVTYLSGPSGTYWKLSRSKLNSKDFYLNARVTTSVTDYNGAIKFTDNDKIKWVCSVSAVGMGIYTTLESMEEDNKGSLLYAISCGGSCLSYTSAFVRIDSNGTRAPFLTTMLKGYSWTIPNLPRHAPRVIHDNNYYFDIWGYSFPSNPLTIQKFNSSLVLPCASTIATTNNAVSVGNPGPMPPSSTIIAVSSYTFGTYSSIGTLATFSVNPNFCTVLGVGENKRLSEELSIYPNPVEDKLLIETSLFMERLQVFDMNGRSLKTFEHPKEIDVSNLPQGIYFLKIKTDGKEFNKKFVKQ